MAEHAILAENLVYQYDGRVAVDGVNFAVGQGEVFGFLGPNGAGKTTIVKMLTGQLRPKSGRALVLGLDVVQRTEQVQAQIGVCFEQANLYEQMSAEANLKLFARLYGVRGYDPLPTLERVGLSGRERDWVANYSKGMRQRLMIARALVSRPSVLFLDEPTDGLDPVSSEAIRNLIREERQRGVTIFLTTHDMLEADKLSDRVAFIDQGKIVALDTPYNLKQQYGERLLEAEVLLPDGRLERREVVLDQPQTAQTVSDLFGHGRVATLHSKEASLEDIFIRITGRRLT